MQLQYHVQIIKPLPHYQVIWAIWLESLLFVMRIQLLGICMLLISICVWNSFVIPQCFLHLFAFIAICSHPLFCVIALLVCASDHGWHTFGGTFLPEVSDANKSNGHRACDLFLLLYYIFWGLQSSHKSVLTMFRQQLKLADKVNPHYINDSYVGQYFPM